jgi:hypothetical protein
VTWAVRPGALVDFLHRDCTKPLLRPPTVGNFQADTTTTSPAPSRTEPSRATLQSRWRRRYARQRPYAHRHPRPRMPLPRTELLR